MVLEAQKMPPVGFIPEDGGSGNVGGLGRVVC